MRLIDADALREQAEAVSYVGLGDIILVGQLDAAPTIECKACEHWDGPFGWLDSRGRGYGRCCIWTITSSPANPGCGKTHFRDTPEDGYCYRFQRRQP